MQNEERGASIQNQNGKIKKEREDERNGRDESGGGPPHSTTLARRPAAGFAFRAYGMDSSALQIVSFLRLIEPRSCMALRSFFTVALGFEFCEAFGYEIPIDDVPECADVFRAAVLMLEVVGVLPNINAKEWLFALADG